MRLLPWSLVFSSPYSWGTLRRKIPIPCMLVCAWHNNGDEECQAFWAQCEFWFSESSVLVPVTPVMINNTCTEVHQMLFQLLEINLSTDRHTLLEFYAHWCAGRKSESLEMKIVVSEWIILFHMSNLESSVSSQKALNCDSMKELLAEQWVCLSTVPDTLSLWLVLLPVTMRAWGGWGCHMWG